MREGGNCNYCNYEVLIMNLTHKMCVLCTRKVFLAGGLDEQSGQCGLTAAVSN